MRSNVEERMRVSQEEAAERFEQNLKRTLLSTKDQTKSRERFERIHVRLSEESNWTRLEPVYLKIVKKNVSQEQIATIVEFYKSPSGRALEEKTPLILRDVNVILRPHSEKALSEAQQMLDEAVLEDRLNGLKR